MFKKAFLFIILTVLLLAGCASKKEDTDVKDKKGTHKDSADSAFVYPLTGEPAKDKKDVDRRSIAVMVNNHPKARPQSGLKQADLVYEILAESNITRFLAIYQSEFPEKVGPIRSARDYYIEIAKGYNSFFVFHGWSPDAKKLIQGGYIDSLNGLEHDGTLFKRASFRKAPHNSYITYENMIKGAEKKKISLESHTPSYAFLTDEETKNIQGQEATGAKVSYSSADFDVIYQYNQESGKYKRSTAGNQTEDYDSKEAVMIDNIMIVEAPHKIIDDKGRRDIDLTAGGKALLLQKGKYVEVEWESRDGRIVPVKDGKEVKLVKGKTWINIVPVIPGLEQSVTFLND